MPGGQPVELLGGLLAFDLRRPVVRNRILLIDRDPARLHGLGNLASKLYRKQPIR